MDENRFDAMTRSLSGVRTRRHVVGGLAVFAMIRGVAFPAAAARKKGRKKPRLNQFGCIDVGEKCFGKDGRCCSGICEGTKKTSRCVAHHAGNCTADDNSCPEPVDCGAAGRCYRTTGKAGFCAAALLCECAPCRKDTDCAGLFGPGAACVVCTSDCVGVNGSRRGTACVAAATMAG